jgi:RimJ/RimL family protein N-acetyltransferase
MNYSKKNEDVAIEPIGKSDLIDVFNLSNQDSVRAASFNSDKIELEEHKKWFADKLKDKNTIMLKAVLEGGFAGQVRLDLKDDKALIGVSVNENYRGKGIASKLLQAAIVEAKKRDVKIIEALIKIENEASASLFEKNGFVYDSETEVLRHKANRYLYKL